MTEKELNDKLQLFDRDFQALQKKYGFRIIAQVGFPGGAILNVPLTVQQVATPPKEKLSAIE